LTQETHALLQDLPHDSEVEIVIEVQFICRMVKGNAKRLGDVKNSQKTDDGVLTFERGLPGAKGKSPSTCENHN